ncbi:MAG: ATP-dependent Clp protease proteolytic subunit [Phycisphaerae bacterium]|nr:ATP-dependent Clp protease proteolytic subunit [Phycisphaerae bacterium]
MIIRATRSLTRRHRRRLLAVAIVAVLLALAASCPADTLLLKDGRTFTGRLVRSDDKVVVFEIHKFGSKMARTFPADQVSKVTKGEVATRPKTPKVTREPKETPKGPAYLVIPIKGVIGREVANDVFRKCLNQARAKKPAVIILEVDSPGGSVEELSGMLDTLKSFRDFRIVAYFKQASSSAALLSMACKEIIAGPTGTIGGAVVYQMTPWGTPTNINEKMASILRAKFRSEAQNAGHSGLLVEGMMATDLVLRVTEENGRPLVVSGGTKGRLLKARGKILTLDARQAVACGLAIGQAETVDKCNTLLGITEWRRLPDVARNMFVAWRKKLESVQKQFATALKEAEDSFNKAGLSHPGRGQYMVDSRTGLLSPASRRQWRQRSDRCAALLKKAEQQLALAATLAAKYPQLGFSKEAIVAQQRRIAALTAEIKAGRKRIGL